MNYTEFEEKVKSMTAHDIIMAMVEGLKNPRTRINMYTFGKIREGTCYGCAATNAVLSIMNANTAEEVEGHIRDRASWVDGVDFLGPFENAIDWLSRGRVDHYNRCASELGIALITPIPGQHLPFLDDNYTKKQLQQYEKLAKYQLTV